MTLPQQDAAEPDGRASLATGALVETIARFATQASALTDQLSVMAAQLIQAERGQAKAERAGIMVLAKLKAAEARLAEQEARLAEQEGQHRSELEILRHQHRAEIIDAEAAGEHYLAQLQAVRDRALAEIASLKRQRDQASAALAAFRASPWWRRAFAPGARQRTPVRPSLNRHSPRTASSG
jgi:chromosome segregation ATPase